MQARQLAFNPVLIFAAIAANFILDSFGFSLVSRLLIVALAGFIASAVVAMLKWRDGTRP